MTQSAPFLTSNSTILWLKFILTAVLMILLYLRYRNRGSSAAWHGAHSLRAKLSVVFAVLFAFGAFHSFGKPRSGTFVHYGEMFHYYLGAKYFRELGHYELYNAVIAADAEQDNALAGIPFYTDLTNYQNAPRENALRNATRVKGLFSADRWNAFKHDVAYFKQATGIPRTPALMMFLMDHGYNASPLSTFVLGALTNAVPVTWLALLASLDLLLVAAMIALSFRVFGLEMGALFSVYFFVNILNDPGYVSGALLRYDWLLCLVASVCQLEKRRFASGAVFLTTAALLKIFPVVLFYGIGVSIARKVKTSRALDRDSLRFIVAAGVTALSLFVLPAAYLGSVVQPWKEFADKTALHGSGVYVNHLGLRGIALFEPSHLSLERFVEAYRSDHTSDIVRHWQDVKEREFQQKKPLIYACSVVVLLCLTAIIWKTTGGEVEAVLWPLLLIYTMSYPSHYYYAFLCLFIILFFRRPNSRSALVPLALLLTFNLGALATDAFGPSPIVFYTLLNIYLFICLASILGFELYTRFSDAERAAPAASTRTRSAPAKRKRSKRARSSSRYVPTLAAQLIQD